MCGGLQNAVGRFDLGQQDRIAAAVQRGGQIGRAPFSVERIDPNHPFRATVRRIRQKVQQLLAGGRFFLRRDCVFEIKDDRIAIKRR